MKNLLLEELERYQTLSNYNTKLTLTENTKVNSKNFIINEQGYGAREIASAFKALKGAAKIGFKDLAAARSTLKISKTITEIEKILAKDSKVFESDLKLAAKNDLLAVGNDFSIITKSGAKTGPLVKELSKIEVLREIAGGKLKSADDILSAVESIKAKNIKIAESAKPRKIRVKGEKADIKNATAEGGIAERELIAAEEEAAKLLAKDTTLIGRFKGLDWKQTLVKGLKIGIPVVVLWWLFCSDNPEAEEPILTDDDVDTGNNDNSGNGGNGSKYTTCPETFPIAQFCKNETIRKVQGCLSIKTDSKFGPKTQAALEAKGLPGTEITQNTVDVACGSKVVEPAIDPNVTLIDGEDGTKI